MDGVVKKKIPLKGDSKRSMSAGELENILTEPPSLKDMKDSPVKESPSIKVFNSGEDEEAQDAIKEDSLHSLPSHPLLSNQLDDKATNDPKSTVYERLTSPNSHLSPSASHIRSVSAASSYTYEEEIGGLGPMPGGNEQGPLRQRKRRNTFSDDEIHNIPRLVHRNLPFKQSRQEIAVVNKTNFKSLKVQRILSQDWYHVFLRQPTWKSLCMLLSTWTFFIVMWALVYQKLDRDNPAVACGLGPVGEPIGFTPAFAFSLETCTTVGYGLPNGTNGFFESDCLGLQIAIYFQMTWSMLFNAFLFAFLFARLARCESRGAQVLFSNKAIMEYRDGKWLLHVRVYDFDSSQPVVEAHVKMYCVSWRDYERQTRDLVQPHLLHLMRILQPDDQLGAPLFTSIPANVTHQIDAYSPLAPLRVRKRLKYLEHGGLPLREADTVCGNRDGVLCPVCGETYTTMDALKRHVEYQRLVEKKDEYPEQGSHLDPRLITPNLFKPLMLTEEQIREQLRDKEIVVVVEGIERKYLFLYLIISNRKMNPKLTHVYAAMVSGTFQALQSYKLSDIVFGGRFAPCMSQGGGKIFVDVDKFHNVLPPNDVSMHRYSKYNGGYTYHNPSMSYLPSFFRSPKLSGRYGSSDDLDDLDTSRSRHQRIFKSLGSIRTPQRAAHRSQSAI